MKKTWMSIILALAIILISSCGTASAVGEYTATIFSFSGVTYSQDTYDMVLELKKDGTAVLIRNGREEDCSWTQDGTNVTVVTGSLGSLSGGLNGKTLSLSSGSGWLEVNLTFEKN